MVVEKRKLPKDGTPPISMLDPPAVPAGEQRPAPAAGGIDYSEMLEPLDKTETVKRKGRGPGPHYRGLINAYVEKRKSGATEEFKVDLDKLRTAMGKPDLSVASIRQGLRINLHSMHDDDERELWETIQVSVDGTTGMLTLKQRKTPKPPKA